MIIAENKRAYFDYEVIETLQAGIELNGHEVKSLKKRGTDLNGAYVIIQKEEAFIIGMTISSFQNNNAPPNYNQGRVKKLLLKKEEVRRFMGKQRSGLTIVPLKIYNNERGLIKVEIALAKRKKEKDKRELLKKRETQREIRRFEN